LGLGDLTSKNTPSSTAVANGWYIDLDAGERVVTDTVATVNGSVFYTTYKPTSDACGYGGKSYFWGVQYDTGNTLPASAKQGKILIQLSTGSFAELNLSSALTDKGGRRTAETSDLSYGKASADPGLFMTTAGMNPVKRILHIQERYK
jgi:type IV pilus assembly protein PilY1